MKVLLIICMRRMNEAALPAGAWPLEFFTHRGGNKDPIIERRQHFNLANRNRVVDRSRNLSVAADSAVLAALPLSVLRP